MKPKKRSKKVQSIEPDAVLVCEDEASLSNTATVSYAWSEKGKQPQVSQIQRKRERITLFGCVEPKTGKVITQASLKGNTLTFFSFLLKTVRAYPNQKVYMVLDNVKYHHAKRLKPTLERYKHRLELIFLPPYSPDLNPMERIWWYMRKKITHNRGVETLQKRLEHFNQLFEHFKQPNDMGKSLANIKCPVYK